MSATEQWYIAQRAEALTRVLLTRRTDLVVTALQDEAHGLDYRVEIAVDGQATGRIFGIQVRARVTALKEDAQSYGHTYDKVTSSTFPVCLFYFTMGDNGAYYRWLIEPVITDEKTPKLSRASADALHKLNSEAIDRIVSQVNDWYEHLYKTLAL